MSTARVGLLFGAVIACVLLGLSTGAVALPLSDVWDGLWHGNSNNAAIVRDLAQRRTGPLRKLGRGPIPTL